MGTYTTATSSYLLSSLLAYMIGMRPLGEIPNAFWALISSSSNCSTPEMVKVSAGALPLAYMGRVKTICYDITFVMLQVKSTISRGSKIIIVHVYIIGEGAKRARHY